MNSGQTTIKDIARIAGVSHTTVSAVLGGRSGKIPVSKKTRALVEEAASSLNYRPNMAARAIRGQSLQQVGLVVRYNADYHDLPTVYVPALFGANEYLLEHGWSLVLIRDDSVAFSPRLPRYLQEHLLDGFIVCSSSEEFDEALGFRLERNRQPFVRMNANGAFNCIKNDDAVGGVLVARHLLELGHRRILYVSPPTQHYSCEARREALRETLAAAGVELDCHTLARQSQPTPKEEDHVRTYVHQQREFIEQCLPKYAPTAVVSWDDHTALTISQGLQKQGIRIPQDISIVGFNDVGLMDLAYPPLTTIHNDFYEMGKLAAGMLLEHIKQNTPLTPSLKTVPRLAVRESTGPAPKR